MRIKFGTIILILLLSLPSLAQDGPPPMPELTGEVVMGGLNGPQGLFIDGDGNLLVIDSGLGGEEIIPFFNTTTLEPVDAQFGLSSRIIKMTPGSEPEVVAMLPSIFAAEDVTGGARVTSLNGTIYATVGGWHSLMGDDLSVENFGGVVAINDGDLSLVGNLWAHESVNNPDGTDNIESHPYGITAGLDGLLYITDAAGNSLVSLDPETGEIATIAVFDGMPGVFPNPLRGGEMLTDPVPTAAVLGAEDNMFVSLLSGAPFIPGTAKVVQVSQDGTVSDFALGMTMLTDLKMGPDGNLYAVSFGMFTEEGPVFNSGSVVRILPEGKTETIIQGLPFATAIAIDAGGNGYVAINGIPIPEAGMVVYYEALTTMEALRAEDMSG